MISHKSMKYILITVNSGYFWKCYNCNTKRVRGSYEIFKLKKDMSVKCVTALTVLVNLVTMVGFLWGGFFVNKVPAIKILAGGCAAMFLVFAVFAVWHLIYMEDTMFLYEQGLAFYKKLCRILCLALYIV